MTLPVNTTTEVVDLIDTVEGLIKDPQLPLVETYVVDFVALAAAVIGIFRPDLKSEISALPQTVITAVALVVLLIINVVRAHEKSSVKKTAIHQAQALAYYRYGSLPPL